MIRRKLSFQQTISIVIAQTLSVMYYASSVWLTLHIGKMERNCNWLSPCTTIQSKSLRTSNSGLVAQPLMQLQKDYHFLSGEDLLLLRC